MSKPVGMRVRLRSLVIALVAAAGIAVVGPGSAAPGDGAGTLLASGHNQYGQLGSTTNNGTTAANPTPTPMTLPGQIGTVAFAAGGAYHSLVVTSSGQVYASGHNYYGQLGTSTNNGAMTPNPTPTLVTLPGQIGTVVHAAAGGHHSLVVTSSGQLYGFGYNFSGQLGNATNNGAAAPNPTPTLVGLPGQVGPVTQVSGGADHSLAATASGQLYAFGSNFHGQLGNVINNGASTANPTPTLVTLPGQIGTIAELAAGEDFSLALTSSGQLYAFGANRYGQLGNATNNTTSNPNPLPTLVTLPGQAGSITRVTAGGTHSLAVTSSGQLYAFGLNGFGQLGNATNNGTSTANPTPGLVTLPGQVGLVTQVAGGWIHSLAVTSSGQLYAFGNNQYGALGSATNSGTSTPNPTPTLVALAAGTTIGTVAKGSIARHSLALVSNLAIATSALPSAQVGAPYQAALQGAGGTSPLTWSASGLPAGLTFDPAGAAISGTPTAAGTFSLTATLTDSYGSSVSTTFTLNVAPAPATPPTIVLAPQAPQLTALKQSAGKWLLGTKLARLVNAVPPVARRKGVPVGTTFSFTSDRAARVALTFRHTVQGRRVSGKCVAKTKSNAGKPRCTRTLTDGALRVQAKAGINRLRFEGRISASKKLKPGTYTVLITATSTAGKTSPAKTLRFTIAKAPVR